jgi:hypothetical protein
MQVKILRRVSKNVFLAWRLYTMKAIRLHQLSQSIISQRMLTLKEKMFDVWMSSATERIMQAKVEVISGRLDDWIKLRAMRKWRHAFDVFQALNWKSARVIFFYWSKLVVDNKVSIKALRKADYYHSIRRATDTLRGWHYVTIVHRNLRLWEFEGRKRMIFWKAKVMLQYWRK